MPERIQRKRAKGWRMPAGVIYVGRGSRWGNPQKWQEWNSTAWRGNDRENKRHAADWFQQELQAGRLSVTCDDARQKLAGCDLACWCRLCPAHVAGKPLGVTCDACDPCHADVLLEIANA